MPPPTPRPQKNALAKITLILATVLLVAVGLCGLNAYAWVLNIDSMEEPLGTLLSYGGIAEVVIIVLCLVGLLICEKAMRIPPPDPPGADE